MDYFKKLLDLLAIEREEDRGEYLQLTRSSSVSQRRANGLTWYPIAIKDSEIGRGDYLTVEIERTSFLDFPHQLRFGVSACLFSNSDPANDRVEGTITWLSGNRLKISLGVDELPDWTRNGKLGIDLLFDDNSYDEMIKACKLATSLYEKPVEGHLIKVLTGEVKPGFQPGAGAGGKTDGDGSYHGEEGDPGKGADAGENGDHGMDGDVVTTGRPGKGGKSGKASGSAGAGLSALNPTQRAAVDKIVAANELAIVHGPPGTGKTTTLVQGIKAMINRDRQQLLVVAPSNAAVDLLTEKLSDAGLNVLRVGNPARVSERLMSLTLDAKMTEHGSNKEIKRLKKQANEFRNMAHKYKRNFGQGERDQRKALFDEARKIMKEVERTEQFIVDDLLTKAQVIAATLVGANHSTVRHLKYHTVVIDEAGQALEPACWVPILKGKKVVLAGDPSQLPPTVKSYDAARKGLGVTLLEKCIRLHPEAVSLLEEQYRMHEVIMGYSSRIFYQDRLKAHVSVARHLLFPEDRPLLFIDTAGRGFDEKQDGTSTTNPEEAAFLFRHLIQLVEELGKKYKPVNFPTIAIISPYKQQVQVLKDLYQHAPTLQQYGDRIAVNTIDSFQGQERDIVYISMTRSNTENKIGFLSDTRRMNVAMTRARKKLVIIGDSGTLSNLPFYANFITYAEGHDAYQSAWEFVED